MLLTGQSDGAGWYRFNALALNTKLLPQPLNRLIELFPRGHYVVGIGDVVGGVDELDSQLSIGPPDTVFVVLWIYEWESGLG